MRCYGDLASSQDFYVAPCSYGILGRLELRVMFLLGDFESLDYVGAVLSGKQFLILGTS